MSAWAAREASLRAVDFLASQYDSATGSAIAGPENVQLYYKMPAFFAYAGRGELARRTLEQLRARFLRHGRLDLSADPIANPWSAYIAGWIAWGAGLLGCFEVGRLVMESVRERQGAELGGWFHEAPVGRLQDTERSGAALMGCIWAGDIEGSRRTADFLEYALDHQPSPGKEFHTYFDADGRCVPDTSDRNAYFSISDPSARPAVFACAIAGLVWLGRATGDSRFFDLARRYTGIVLAHEADPARLPLATKFGWAALMLAEHDSNLALVEIAKRSGSDLVARVRHDGSVDFDTVPNVPKPLDPAWTVGWGVDAALTLIAVGEGGA